MNAPVSHSNLAAAGTATGSTTRTIRAACPHDCPDTCAMLVTVEGEVTMPDGSVRRIGERFRDVGKSSMPEK